MHINTSCEGSKTAFTLMATLGCIKSAVCTITFSLTIYINTFVVNVICRQSHGGLGIQCYRATEGSETNWVQHEFIVPSQWAGLPRSCGWRCRLIQNNWYWSTRNVECCIYVVSWASIMGQVSYNFWNLARGEWLQWRFTDLHSHISLWSRITSLFTRYAQHGGII